MNIIFKRFLALLLSFMIAFVPAVSFAASPVGWSASPADIIINGATATVTAFKKQGGQTLKSVVAHAPKAANVGKKLLRGAGTAALLIAIPQMIGEGVDWVLDPANNRVIYYPAVPNVDGGTCQGVGWFAYGQEKTIGYHSTSLGACKAMDAKFGGNKGATMNGDQCIYGGGAGKVLSYAGACDASNPTFTPYPQDAPVPAYLPIDAVGAQVIEDAKAGKPAAQDVIKGTTIDDIDGGLLDDVLDSLAKPTTDTPTTDTPTTDAPPTFDPSSIIAAIASLGKLLSSLVSLLSSFFDWFMEEWIVFTTAITDFFTWVRAEPETVEEDTELNIPTPDIVPSDTDINFGGSCPANFEINSSIFGKSINIVLLDSAKFCGFLSTFVKYPVYAVSSLYALYILGGRKDV